MARGGTTLARAAREQMKQLRQQGSPAAAGWARALAPSASVGGTAVEAQPQVPDPPLNAGGGGDASLFNWNSHALNMGSLTR